MHKGFGDVSCESRFQCREYVMSRKTGPKLTTKDVFIIPKDRKNWTHKVRECRDRLASDQQKVSIGEQGGSIFQERRTPHIRKASWTFGQKVTYY